MQCKKKHSHFCLDEKDFELDSWHQALRNVAHTSWIRQGANVKKTERHATIIPFIKILGTAEFW